MNYVIINFVYQCNLHSNVPSLPDIIILPCESQHQIQYPLILLTKKE